MGIVVIIDDREAIPVRAIPFVAGWMLSPDVVAKTFAKTDHWITRLEGISAYYLSVSGKYSPMLAKEWDGIEADLEILSDKLKATEEFEQENYPAWRQQSILRLPASCFVWRDEFEEAFRRSYSPGRLLIPDERPGDRDLNFSPRIPEELALAVMQGFSMIQPHNGSSSPVEKPLKPNIGMGASTPAAFESLETALEGWFDKPLAELPDALRHRVETDFFPMPWDDLSPDQRRSGGAQWDYKHDPAMENERQYWWDFYICMNELKKQIETWTAIATPTATDLAQKETRLAELQRELANMKKEENQPYKNPADRQRHPLGGQPADAPHTAGKPEYIAYPKAMKLLAEGLEATPEELAAWVFYGPEPELGGLAAYLNANELDPPPRFYYANYVGSFDYIAPLMSCWFIVEEIANFQPTERYITGKALIERWSKQPSIQPEAYILAKIAESRLMDCHPIYGGTEATFSGMGSFPPLETGLFALSHIEEIEASDFGNDENNSQADTKPAEQLALDPQTQQSASEIDEGDSIGTDQGITENECAVFRAMKNLTADQVSIIFVGDKPESGIGANNMLEISAQGETRRVALAALDLVDRRGGKLRKHGYILLGMAQKIKHTYIENKHSAQMTRLREVFYKHLGIKDDPFDDYRKGAGWEPRFKIEDKRGALDERAKLEAEHYKTDSLEELPELANPEDELNEADSLEKMDESGEKSGDTNQSLDPNETDADKWMGENGHNWQEGSDPDAPA